MMCSRFSTAIFLLTTLLSATTLDAAKRSNTRAYGALTVTSSAGFSLAPGDSTTLTLTPTPKAAASVTWKEKTGGNKWTVLAQGVEATLTTKSLPAYSCEHSVHEVKVELNALSTKTEAPIEFTITVQNPICRLTRKDGLTSNAITKIAIANDETIFIGTEDGLTVLRGPTMKALRYSSAGEGRPLKIITTLSESPKGDMWVGNAIPLFWLYGKTIKGRGIERYSRTKSTIWKREPILPNSYVSSISFGDAHVANAVPIFLTQKNYLLPTEDGAIGGLYIGDATANLLRRENLYASLQLSSDFWLFGGDKGLHLFQNDREIKNFHPSEHSANPILGNPYAIGSLIQGRDNKIWAGLITRRPSPGHDRLPMNLVEVIWAGINYFRSFPGKLAQIEGLENPSQNPTLHWNFIDLPISNAEIRDIIVDLNNDLWIATDKGLIRRKANGQFRSFKVTEGLSNNDVRDLFYDEKRDFLWVGTKSGVTGILVSSCCRD